MEDPCFKDKLEEKVKQSERMKKAMGSLKLNYEPPSHLKNITNDQLFAMLKK